MTTTLMSIVNELKSERAAGQDMADQLVGRIDAHIRDLETLRAWIIDNARVRTMALDGLLGIPSGIDPLSMEGPQPPPVLENE